MRTRVLLAEDNETLADGVAMLLGEQGMKVDVVHDGRRVFGMVAHSRPDVVVLDVSLPGLSGPVVARELRGAWPELPIIFATGNAGSPELHEARTNRRTVILEKPFEMETLFAAIEKLTRNRRSSRSEAGGEERRRETR